MNKNKTSAYYIICFILVALLALSFLFPLYWIITGSFKVKADIISKTPVWVPTQWVMDNYQSLLSKRSAPLFQIGSLVGPTIPAAFRCSSIFAAASSGVTTPHILLNVYMLKGRLYSSPL